MSVAIGIKRPEHGRSFLEESFCLWIHADGQKSLFISAHKYRRTQRTYLRRCSLDATCGNFQVSEQKPTKWLPGLHSLSSICLRGYVQWKEMFVLALKVLYLWGEVTKVWEEQTSFVRFYRGIHFCNCASTSC